MAVKARNKRKGQHTKREVPTDLPRWSALIWEAVNVPGLVAKCYALFHDYSVGNQMLAYMQCKIRGIEPGPIGTYKKWLSLGRKVVSGPGSAIWLCMPVTWEYKDPDDPDKTLTAMKFVYKPQWFVLSQTEGAEYVPDELPGFDIGEAIVNLEVEPVPFAMTDGNAMGYASGRTFAINPLGQHQNATTMHELAHIVLGHTKEAGFEDGADRTPRNIKEMEAELTAMLVLDSLGDEDHAESRGYIQVWYKENEVPEESARHIFTAANTILKAGRGERS